MLSLFPNACIVQSPLSGHVSAVISSPLAHTTPSLVPVTSSSSHTLSDCQTVAEALKSIEKQEESQQIYVMEGDSASS